MKLVKLDNEYEKWRKKNEAHLKEQYLEVHGFYEYLEEAWHEYQWEHELVDESNEAYNKLVAVKINGKVEMFGFETDKDKNDFVKDLKKKFPGTEFIQTTGEDKNGKPRQRV